MKEGKLVLSVEAAGKLLGVSRPTAYKLAKAGQIPTLRLGRRIVVPKAALEKLLLNAGNKEIS